jgi:hypothetical protein
LILTVLSLSSKRRLQGILEALPREILKKLRDFTEHYQPEIRVFHGPRPNIRAVQFAREWLAEL